MTIPAGLRQPSDTSLTIDADAPLREAMERFGRFQAGFTLFAIDAGACVVGSLTRGDVIRCLAGQSQSTLEGLATLRVSDAMKRKTTRADPDGMQFVTDDRISWWSQITDIRDRVSGRYRRIRLIPVLDEDERLVNVLDIEEPRTRSRLETLVMAVAFPLPEAHGALTAEGLAQRRAEFESIHYGTHWQKIEGLCELLLQDDGARFPFIDDIFTAARADEVLHGLARAEEWLQGSLASPISTPDKRKALEDSISKARKAIAEKYTLLAAGQSYYPRNDKGVHAAPEVIVVLGCKRDDPLKARVEEAVKVVKAMRRDAPTPTLVLSGGGSGDRESEALRMLQFLRKHSSAGIDEVILSGGFARGSVVIAGRAVQVVLEEDSLDTLGNAVFSWCVLKLTGQPGLEGREPSRLSRMVIVTDRLHAPRSFDLFRRVFAFRPPNSGVPNIVVRLAATLSSERDEKTAGLDQLRNEAVANSKSFRLVNPLTNGFDIMEDGHVRSVFAQLLRLHEYYQRRWDLARKYKDCWSS